MEDFTASELKLLMGLVSNVAVPQTVNGKGDKDLAILRELWEKLNFKLLEREAQRDA